jgi:hypothetical protein
MNPYGGCQRAKRLWHPVMQGWIVANALAVKERTSMLVHRP